MEFERGVFTLKKTGRYFKPLKESQPIRIKQTQRAPTEGASDNKGKVSKFNSELEKEFTWLIYDAKAQLLFCQHCSETAKKSKSDILYIVGNKIF